MIFDSRYMAIWIYDEDFAGAKAEARQDFGLDYSNSFFDLSTPKKAREDYGLV